MCPGLPPGFPGWSAAPVLQGCGLAALASASVLTWPSSQRVCVHSSFFFFKDSCMDLREQVEGQRERQNLPQTLCWAQSPTQDLT